LYLEAARSATVVGSGRGGGREGERQAVARDGLGDGAALSAASIGNNAATINASGAGTGVVASAGRRASEASTEIEASGARSAPGGTVPAVGAPEGEVLGGADGADTIAVGGNGAVGVHGQEALQREVDGGGHAVEVEVRGRGNERGGSDGGVEVQETASKLETRGGDSGVELEVGRVQSTSAEVGGAGRLQIEINGAVEGTVGSPEAVTIAEVEERTL